MSRPNGSRERSGRPISVQGSTQVNLPAILFLILTAAALLHPVNTWMFTFVPVSCWFLLPATYTMIVLWPWISHRTLMTLWCQMAGLFWDELNQQGYHSIALCLLYQNCFVSKSIGGFIEPQTAGEREVTKRVIRSRRRFFVNSRPNTCSDRLGFKTKSIEHVTGYQLVKVWFTSDHYFRSYDFLKWPTVLKLVNVHHQ